MNIAPDNDPLEAYGYDVTMTVPEVMEFLDVSDGTARKFLKSHDLYLKVSGAVRVPRLGLSRVLFERKKSSVIVRDSVIDFPEAKNHESN